MEKIAVVGCGLIGQGWASIFAQAGYEVGLFDASMAAAEHAFDSMESRIKDLSDHGLVAPSEVGAILNRIKLFSSLDGALDRCIYVQENGPEDLSIKTEITKRIDAMVPVNVPIGSSTSGIKASAYSQSVMGKKRCLVVHPINPPHLIPAVEIVPSDWTDPDVVSFVTDLMDSCGRKTIRLKHEVDGFVVNRLQGALLEEAFKLIGDGVVSPDDLDKAICDGLGLRWSFMGPMETIHLNAPKGISQYAERYGPMYRNFEIGPYDDIDWMKVVNEKLREFYEQMVPLEQIPQAQIERDKKLMALLKHKESMPRN